MAVHCGVCATQISCAWENGGSFRSSDDFDGWDRPAGRDKFALIQDTCEDCAKILSKAVCKAAKQIAQKHKIAIKELAANMDRARKIEREMKEKEAEFRRAWEEKRRSEKR